MLWINGYSRKGTQLLKLTPKPGRAYWGNHLSSAGYVFNDWHWVFVDPEIKTISTPASRFREGYLFALENEKIIRNNILVCGNKFQIVAHGQAVAFAEGVSAYFFEEKGIVTDLAVYLQGARLAETPQCRRAVDCRVVCTSDNNLRFPKNQDSLKFKDVTVYEKDLQTGYFRYTIALTDKENNHKISHLYFRFSLKDKRSHFMHLKRSFPLWSSVEHGLKMYIENEIDSCADNVADVRNMMLEKHIMN